MIRALLRRLPAGRTGLRRLGAVAGRLLPAPPAGPIVTICHCHHPELVPELARVLRRLPAAAAIHVTSSRPEVFARWRALEPRRGPAPLFHAVENRGRDIRPFFATLRGLDLSPDTLVLKLHGKLSSYSARGGHWRRDLLGGLLPDRRAAGLVSARFRADPRLGMLGAPNSFVGHPVYWGENRAGVAALMVRAFGAPPHEDDLGFFAGSMFWIRAGLLAELSGLVDLEAFEPEPLAQDGSYAHALERAIPMAARRLGWRLAEHGRRGSLDPEAVRERRVAYL